MSSHGSSLVDPLYGSASPGNIGNKTSSAVSVHTGEHLFKVFRHSRIKGINTCLTSKQFRVGGHDWAILYYPNGFLSVNDGQFTSVYLRLMNASERQVNLSYTFCLQDPAAPLTGEKNKYGSTCKLSSKRDKEGVRKFVSKDDLAASGCLKDDCLVIKCYVEVIDDQEEITVPPSEMSRDLRNLFERGFKTDLTIMVGRFRSFEAHACILAARSPVFHAQLCGPMMESKENIIQIDGMSAKVFEILLYYIYNDCLPKFMDDATKDATNMAQHLLVAADRYAIERLKLICESKLCKTLAISSVGYTLNLAEQYSCHDLKARCLKFIGKNREKLRSVENAGGFVQLKHNYPLLAQDALGKLTGKKKKKNQWSK
jgi:speckle-type POZ protein